MAIVKLSFILAFACLAWSARSELNAVEHRRVSSVTRVSDGNGTALAELDVKVNLWTTADSTKQAVTASVNQAIQKLLFKLQSLGEEPQQSYKKKSGMTLLLNETVWEDVVVSAPKQVEVQEVVNILVWAKNKKHRDELLASVAGRI